jgi:hypothetical protein
MSDYSGSSEESSEQIELDVVEEIPAEPAPLHPPPTKHRSQGEPRASAASAHVKQKTSSQPPKLTPQAVPKPPNVIVKPPLKEGKSETKGGSQTSAKPALTSSSKSSLTSGDKPPPTSSAGSKPTSSSSNQPSKPTVGHKPPTHGIPQPGKDQARDLVKAKAELEEKKAAESIKPKILAPETSRKSLPAAKPPSSYPPPLWETSKEKALAELETAVDRTLAVITRDQLSVPEIAKFRQLAKTLLTQTHIPPQTHHTPDHDYAGPSTSSASHREERKHGSRSEKRGESKSHRKSRKRDRSPSHRRDKGRRHHHEERKRRHQ